jgi:hypothetical protein
LLIGSCAKIFYYFGLLTFTMDLQDKLNNRDKWTENDVQQYNEFVIEHESLPIEIVVEETGSHAEKNENWEAWLHVKEDSFEETIPALLFDETFEYKDEAKVFAREMAYKRGIEQRL